ncbi:hypothetical protein ABPG75_011492 [Micractinium tetrahymenae]
MCAFFKQQGSNSAYFAVAGKEVPEQACVHFSNLSHCSNTIMQGPSGAGSPSFLQVLGHQWGDRLGSRLTAAQRRQHAPRPAPTLEILRLHRSFLTHWCSDHPISGLPPAQLRTRRDMGRSALALALLLAASSAWALDGCTVKSSGSSASIVCTGDVPETASDGSSWDEVLQSLQSTSSVSLEFNDMPNLSADGCERLLSLVAGAGSSNATGTVTATLSSVNAERLKVDLLGAFALGGSTQYSITVKNSTLIGNELNVTALVAAQDNLDVTLSVLGSVIHNNQLLAAAGGAVGGTTRIALSLAEGSSLQGNAVFLAGLLLGGGDGDLSQQLANSNDTDNAVALMGAVLLGGNATGGVTGADDPSVITGNNTLYPQVMLFDEVPLVRTLTDILTGLTFSEPGFNLSASLSQAQGQLCSFLSDLDVSSMAAGDAGMPSNVEAQVAAALIKLAGALCNGDKPAADFDLGSLAPALESALSGSTQSSAVLVRTVEALLESLLADQADGTLEALVGALLNNTADAGSALNSLLSVLLSSPEGDAAASAIADFIGRISDWLGRPIGGGAAAPTPSAGSPPGSTPSGPSGGDDLGSIIGDILGSIGGPIGQAAAGVASLVQSLIDSLMGKGGGGQTPEQILQQIVDALGGASGPLAGVDVSQITGLLPILKAVVADPAARAALPGLLQLLLGGGGLDAAAIGPLVSAILGDPQAAGALPNLLGLLSKLGINVGGLGGR